MAASLKSIRHGDSRGGSMRFEVKAIVLKAAS
jgi:hypothetical protein